MLRIAVGILVVSLSSFDAHAASRGEKIFHERCSLCHPVDQGYQRGPGLGAIVGRKAATLAGFSYTPALEQSGLTWTRASLDRFLANPLAAVPGTVMPIPVPDASERAALIDYLSTLHSTANRGARRKPVLAERVVPRPATAGVLTGAAAFGDFRSDGPGVQRRITLASLPRPFASRSSRNGPDIVRQPADAELHVPAGFTVTPFAQLEQPRLLRTAPNGDLFVAESYLDRVVVVRPRGQGAEAPRVFASGLDRPFGIAFWPPGPSPQFVYVAENNRVVRFPYTSGVAEARGKPEVVIAHLTDGSEGHWTRDIAFSPDGKTLYVSVGSASNIGEDMPKKSAADLAAWEKAHGLGAAWGEETNRADVLVFDEQGHGGSVFASGIRNCVGMAVDARGAVWCATNERDGLGDDLVPDYVTRVTKGAYYGWPWWYLGEHEEPRLAGRRPDLRGKATVPEVLLQAHSAALEPALYDGTQFPAEYRGDLFVALHGSWNRSGRTGYKVVRVRVKDGAPTGVYEDFLTGFVADADHVWGRPVGVAVGKDGSLYVSEDASSVVYRVSYASPH